jgi:ribonuclease HI
MELYIDGGCSGNWQRDMSKRTMVAVVTDGHGDVVSEWRGSGGSNNIAELIALRDALTYADYHRWPSVVIYTDSQNIIAWARSGKPGKKLNDRTRVLELLVKVSQLMQSVYTELRWVPRDRNLAGHVIEAKDGL